MRDNEFDRRQFIKIAAGSALCMLNIGSPALFAKVAVPKTRSHYKVFSRGRIGSLQIKNRLIKAATATAATTGDCRFLSGGIDMYRDWSKGGVGLINTGHMTATPIPSGTYNHNLTCIYDDRFIPQIRKIAEAVHTADSECKVVAQINHIGMHSTKYPIAASSVRWRLISKKPRPLSTPEVQQIRDSFVAAARIAKEAEFDGVEIHGAHGYLLNTFLSPYTNKRTDDYGGSIENRVRIIAEIVDRIKTSVDPDFAVLIKTNCDDGLGAEGINEDNFPQLAHELEKTGIDAVEISGVNPARTNIDAPEKQSYFAGYAEKKVTNQRKFFFFLLDFKDFATLASIKFQIKFFKSGPFVFGLPTSWGTNLVNTNTIGMHMARLTTVIIKATPKMLRAEWGGSPAPIWRSAD